MKNGTAEALGVLIAFVAFIAFAITFLLAIMACWGLLFMGFDWLFPGVLREVLPTGIGSYEPFTIGAVIGFAVMIVKSALSSTVVRKS